MPQMKPMNWLIIMLYTMFTYLMMTIKLNYMKNQYNNNMKFKLKPYYTPLIKW